MIELAEAAFGRLLPRLVSVPFNHLFARAVLDGHAGGRVWVDDAARPGFVHILTRYGMSLVIGEGPEAPGWRVLGEHLRAGSYRQKDEWMQVHLATDAETFDRLIDYAKPMPGAPVEGERCQCFVRLNFRFDPARHQAGGQQNDPPELCVRSLTAAEFALPDVTVSPHLFWRDFEQCVAAGGGWCVEVEGELAALAFASFRSGERLEIGIETRPAHRRRGHARRAVQALIGHCLREGLEPVWACHGDNIGSAATARSLGFVDTLRLPYYRLPARTAA